MEEKTDKAVVKSQTQKQKKDVGIVAYLSLIFAIVFFSGIFKSAHGPLAALDFTNLLGSFGNMGALTEGAGKLANDFRGLGGSGAKDGFLFAITLFAPVMFALGVVKMVEHLGGLKAAQKLLTPILRPLMGIPGISGLSMIAHLQSTDACASMTNQMVQNGEMTEKERIIYCAFQISGGGLITNFFSSGAALFPFFVTGMPISIPLLVVVLFKIFGANLMRIFLIRFGKE